MRSFFETGGEAKSAGTEGKGSGPAGDLLEIRIHGRGGQGGVTCAKIVAATYARGGKSVQSFGDYAGERSGAPVKAFVRVSGEAITNRNKVTKPDHVVVLDPTLLGAEVVAGMAPGGVLAINTAEAREKIATRFPAYRVAVVDATSIARRHGIGTRSVVIVNTTMAGAIAKALGLGRAGVEETLEHLGLGSNAEAAREAYDAVAIGDAVDPKAASAPPPPRSNAVLPLTEHREAKGTGLPTGSWRTQEPRYVEHLAPCNAWCPAGNDAVGFVQALATKGEATAARVLGASTPLAATCGHVCPAPCMEGCNRREYDGAVQIKGLERWIAERVPVAWRPGPNGKTRTRRVAIVGAGPAGLSAAYTLLRKGHAAILYEGERALGGMLRTGIPTFRLPRGVVDREIAGILALGAEVRSGKFVDAALLKQIAAEHDAVIVATGLRSLRGLDAPGSWMAGIRQGIAFLHQVNLDGGAVCAGHVVVLGGGNTAIDCARSALRCGAKRVTIAYRRTRAEMPAIPEEIVEAEDEGVQIVYQRQPLAFYGPGPVRGVELGVVEMGEPDATGRRTPVLTDRTQRLDCDEVLLALGQEADRSVLPEEWDTREGRMWARKTALSVWAAGDFATGDGTVAHAIGDGRRAAERALAALGEAVEVSQRPDRRRAVPATDIRFEHFPKVAPSRERVNRPADLSHNFASVNCGIEGPLEAHRCFSCGHCTRCDTCLVYCPEGVVRRRDGAYDVDYAFCKGCGICVNECPREAMEMVPL